MAENLDHIDIRILDVLQAEGGLSQRQIAERVGLSQNALWRRMQRLNASGVLAGQRYRVDRAALGLDLVVFVLVKTRHHSREWLDRFRRHVETIPEVTSFYRIGGEWDYMIQVVTGSMADYDAVYQRLIGSMELDAVTGYFAMEAIFEDRPLSL